MSVSFTALVPIVTTAYEVLTAGARLLGDVMDERELDARGQAQVVLTHARSLEEQLKRANAQDPDNEAVAEALGHVTYILQVVEDNAESVLDLAFLLDDVFDDLALAARRTLSREFLNRAKGNASKVVGAFRSRLGLLILASLTPFLLFGCSAFTVGPAYRETLTIDGETYVVQGIEFDEVISDPSEVVVRIEQGRVHAAAVVATTDAPTTSSLFLAD